MTGRPPSCECGECRKCRRRVAARLRWQRLSPDERRAVIAARDPEKVKAADRARYYRHRDARLKRMRAWAAENRERMIEHNRAWSEANPHKKKAHGIVAQAIRRGDLERQPCEVCGTTENVHAHHDDYSKPLDVRWLCSKHHGEVHRVYKEAA